MLNEEKQMSKSRFVRLVPVLLATGLWVFGNVCLSGVFTALLVSAAKAQEGQQQQICTDDPVQKLIISNHCVLSPDRYHCSGGCSGTLVKTRSCKPTSTNYGGFACYNNGLGYGQDYAGGCLTDPGAGCECGQLQPVGASYTISGLGCTGITPIS